MRNGYTQAEKIRIAKSAKKIGIREASRQHGIPRATVGLWVKQGYDKKKCPNNRQQKIDADIPTLQDIRNLHKTIIKLSARRIIKILEAKKPIDLKTLNFVYGTSSDKLGKLVELDRPEEGQEDDIDTQAVEITKNVKDNAGWEQQQKQETQEKQETKQ